MEAETQEQSTTMTLRDQFAVQAMQAILSSGCLNENEHLPSYAFSEGGKVFWNCRGHRHGIAAMAYEMADAMLEMRSK